MVLARMGRKVGKEVEGNGLEPHRVQKWWLHPSKGLGTTQIPGRRLECANSVGVDKERSLTSGK